MKTNLQLSKYSSTAPKTEDHMPRKERKVAKQRDYAREREREERRGEKDGTEGKEGRKRREREGRKGREKTEGETARERERGKERKNKRDSVSHCWAVSTVRCPHPTHCPLQPWRWVEGRRSSGVRRTWTEWQPGTAHTCRLSCTRHSVLTLRSPYHCLPCVACA